jgi:hypothetical protein
MIVDHALSIVRCKQPSEEEQHLHSIMTEEHKPYPMAKYVGSSEFFATRNCPDCHRRLVKRDAFITVVCPCGWGWK